MDIVDIGQFSKHRFPASHLRVLKKIMRTASTGTQYYYLSGHIHQPKKEVYQNEHGITIYLISGVWVETLPPWNRLSKVGRSTITVATYYHLSTPMKR